MIITIFLFSNTVKNYPINNHKKSGIEGVKSNCAKTVNCTLRVGLGRATRPCIARFRLFMLNIIFSSNIIHMSISGYGYSKGMWYSFLLNSTVSCQNVALRRGEWDCTEDDLRSVFQFCTHASVGDKITSNLVTNRFVPNPSSFTSPPFEVDRKWCHVTSRFSWPTNERNPLYFDQQQIFYLQNFAIHSGGEWDCIERGEGRWP